MKNRTPALSPGWMHAHLASNPKPVHYVPLPSDADVQEAPGDLCGLGGDHDTGSQLRAIHAASRREQARIERGAR